MSVAAAVTWLFNWMLSFSWPMIDRAMRHTDNNDSFRGQQDLPEVLRFMQLGTL